MSVEAQDLSNYSGAPIMLYEFSRRSVATLTKTEVVTFWRYTSADRDFVLGDITYSAIAISDDGVRQSGDTTADQLTITVPFDAAVPQMFVGSPPSDPIYCMIKHGNLGETDTFLVWVGLIGMVTRSSTAGDASSDVSAQIVCNTIGATMDRSGLRLTWSRSCPHDLYGFECRADPTQFYVHDVIVAIDGATVTGTAIGAVNTPQLAGGFMEWIEEDTGHASRLGVTDHKDSTITVLGTTDRLTVGQTIYVFFGCDHTRATCQLVFGNEVNHGGHAYMPDANPFDGDLIF